MKNIKGFTLVELLAVIAILGVIITISVVSVSGTINRSTDSGYKIIEDQMVEAAKQYVAENFGSIVNDSVVNLNTLINGGYLKDVKDPANKNDTCDYTNSKITVTISGNKYTYTPYLVCESYTTPTTP